MAIPQKVDKAYSNYHSHATAPRGTDAVCDRLSVTAAKAQNHTLRGYRSINATAPFHYSLFLSVAFHALIAEQGILRPLAVDLDKAAELLIVAADRVHDLHALAVDLQPCALHERFGILADKISEADGVGLAVVDRQIPFGHSAEVVLFRDHLADRVFRQLDRHIVQPRFKDEDLLLHRVEVGGDALADTLEIAVIVLQRPVLELKAVDLRDQVYHETPLHIIIQQRIGIPRLVPTAFTAIFQDLP